MRPARCRCMPPVSFACRFLSTTLVLSLTRPAKAGVRPMFGKYVGAFLVIENAAQPVAISGCREPWSDTGFAYDIHVRSLFDQQLEQRVPSTIRWTEECVFIKG